MFAWLPFCSHGTKDPISPQRSISIPPENARKPELFTYSGGIEKEHWHEMGL